VAGDTSLTLVEEVKEQLATTTTAGTGVWESARANLSVDMLICIDAHQGSSDSAELRIA
jgi:hypothetical protein